LSFLDKLKQKKFLVKDGHWLAVLRPVDPKLAIKLAHDLIGKQAHEEFQEILTKQPYQFIGYASRKGIDVLDGDGKVIDRLRVGDSFAHGERFTPPRVFTRSSAA
jgi:hypothetical protein